jgi:hypothetical protein
LRWLRSVSPLVEQGQDLGHLLVEQPVHRGPARRPVGQPTTGPAGDPAVRPPLRQLQLVTDPAQRPPGVDRLVEQVEQPGLGGRVHPAWDPAT